MSKKRLWAGRIMSALPVLFLLFDAIVHIMKLPIAVEGFIQLGYDPSISAKLGFVLLICVILYLIEPTSVLGAVLLTGYLGGAVATNVRVAAPFFSFILSPVYVGILLWGGLWLRDGRLAALFPFRRTS